MAATSKKRPSAAEKRKKDAAHEELIAAGVTLEKKEDRWGDTRSGYWYDDTYLCSDPRYALEKLRG